MANAAQKKLAAANVVTLKNHRYAFFVVNAVFIIVRLILRRYSASWKLYILYLLSFGLAGWLQLQLEKFGRPGFDERGQVITTGEDLGQAGMTEYMFDIIYLTWGIQLLVAFTTIYAFWLYLAIPVYGGLKLWNMYKGQVGPQTAPAQEQFTQKQSRSQRRAVAKR